MSQVLTAYEVAVGLQIPHCAGEVDNVLDGRGIGWCASSIPMRLLSKQAGEKRLFWAIAPAVECQSELIDAPTVGRSSLLTNEHEDCQQQPQANVACEQHRLVLRVRGCGSALVEAIA